jgi:isovaleryl-CoA dehydrogenase
MLTSDMFNPSDEHLMVREMVRNFVEEYVEPQALEYDRLERFNLDLFKQLGELGLLGLTAPEEFGGAGMDATAAVIVHEELSTSDPGFSLAYLAHSMLFVNNLAVNGSDEQKARFLPGVCSGQDIGCMAMSEPDVGTDVLGLSTTAVQNEDGDWVLNGRKMWITNGCIDDEGTPADIVWIYAKTGVDDRGRNSISTFIV